MNDLDAWFANLERDIRGAERRIMAYEPPKPTWRTALLWFTF